MFGQRSVAAHPGENTYMCSCNGVWCLLFGIRRWQHGLGFVLLLLWQRLALCAAQRESFHTLPTR